MSGNGSGNGSTPPGGGEAFPKELVTGGTQETTTEELAGNEEPTGAGLESLLAAIGKMPFSLKLILIILGLVILALIILWLFRRKKKDKEDEE